MMDWLRESLRRAGAPPPETGGVLQMSRSVRREMARDAEEFRKEGEEEIGRQVKLRESLARGEFIFDDLFGGPSCPVPVRRMGE
jgi:hypothetical protein